MTLLNSSLADDEGDSNSNYELYKRSCVYNGKHLQLVF